MDQVLMFIGMILFAALYIGMGVFLFWTILICVLAIILYIGVRYKNVQEHYPYNVSESLGTLLMIAVIWVIFVIVGPKNPIPFLGNSFLYNPLPESTASGILSVLMIFLFIILIIVAMLIPWLEGRGGGLSSGGGGGGGGEGQIGVGT